MKHHTNQLYKDMKQYGKTHVGNNRSEEMKEIKDRIKEIEKLIPVNQIIYGYKPSNEKQEILFHEYLLLKQLDDLYSSSVYRIIVK